jgi:ribosomal protein L30
MAKLRITYKKSAIGYSYMQKDTIRSLGLRKLNSSAIQDDTPSIRGMIFKVRHLVAVEEVVGGEPAVAAKAPATTKQVQTTAGDNLQEIEGIGPKISGVLVEAGIATFAQLAQATPDQLTDIMQAAKVRLTNPETWPEQAALAAAGQWDELKALQARLTGGRRSE